MINQRNAHGWNIELMEGLAQIDTLCGVRTGRFNLQGVPEACKAVIIRWQPCRSSAWCQRPDEGGDRNDAGGWAGQTHLYMTR